MALLEALQVARRTTATAWTVLATTRTAGATSLILLYAKGKPLVALSTVLHFPQVGAPTTPLPNRWIAGLRIALQQGRQVQNAAPLKASLPCHHSSNSNSSSDSKRRHNRNGLVGWT